jgi:hypothetical protein
MNVEIMQWDLRLSDVVKFKSIISLAQLHGQLNPPPALPFTCVVLFSPTDIRSFSNSKNYTKYTASFIECQIIENSKKIKIS